MSLNRTSSRNESRFHPPCGKESNTSARTGPEAASCPGLASKAINAVASQLGDDGGSAAALWAQPNRPRPTVATRRHATASDANPRKPNQRNVPVAKRRQVSTTCLVMIDTEHFQPQMNTDFMKDRSSCLHLRLSAFICGQTSNVKNAVRIETPDSKMSTTERFPGHRFPSHQFFCQRVQKCDAVHLDVPTPQKPGLFTLIL